MVSKVEIIKCSEVGLPKARLWRDGKCVAEGYFDRFSQTPSGEIEVLGSCDFSLLKVRGMTINGALTALAQAAYQAEIDWKAGRI